jgi:hypothetical protein
MSTGDPYDDFEYIKPPDEESKQVEKTPDEQSQVAGTLELIAELEREVRELSCNQTVTFAGMVCPIIAVTADRVKIQHGPNVLWISKDEALKSCSGLQKPEINRKWSSKYSNRLPLPPSR